jgi:hypothetical protein
MQEKFCLKLQNGSIIYVIYVIEATLRREAKSYTDALIVQITRLLAAGTKMSLCFVHPGSIFRLNWWLVNMVEVAKRTYGSSHKKPV